MSISNTQSSPFARNLNVVKMYFKKPVALAICIVSLATFILTIVTEAQTTAALNEFAALMSTEAEITDMSGNVFSYLISGIAILCFFMIYMFSKTDKGSPAPFFTVLHVFSVLQLVGSSILAIGWVILCIVLIANTESIINAVAEMFPGIFSMDTAQMQNIVDSFKGTIVILLVISIIAFALSLFFINSQTAFLKSCKRSCKEPSLFTKGAKPYSILCFVGAVAQLVLMVMSFLLATSLGGDESEMVTSITVSSMTSLIPTTSLILLILGPINLFLRGTLASGWIKFAAENESFVYAAAAAATRSPELNPIATYKSVERSSNNAIRQNQAYLYGEEENNDPAKKSSYIPEELQQDYSAQQYDPTQFVAPMQFDPQYAQQPQDSFMQPMQQDPFAQSPIVYGQPPMQDPNQNPYNNGMM